MADNHYIGAAIDELKWALSAKLDAIEANHNESQGFTRHIGHRAAKVTLRRLKECQEHGLTEWGFVTPNKHLITALFTLGWVAKKPGVTASPASADDVVITEAGRRVLEGKKEEAAPGSPPSLDDPPLLGDIDHPDT